MSIIYGVSYSDFNSYKSVTKKFTEKYEAEIEYNNYFSGKIKKGCVSFSTYDTNAKSLEINKFHYFGETLK